ncbi:hypothetical protein TASI_1291 [Taylorella asinigenitalis MCE3]|uniref:Uncharacterized protein n=1 Tax=Taylorella asinigenitalis (strain MCE3) TaxID=1008459 RepID=G4QC65_TAYAM|nr:hypothetical protein TASI_1291 [Taylorella asinigenitalis MCE3]
MKRGNLYLEQLQEACVKGDPSEYAGRRLELISNNQSR